MLRSALALARRLVADRRIGSPFHGRGLARFEAKLSGAGLPSLATEIETRLRDAGHCAILEIGCGEGHLLLDVLVRFGDRVELHGVNHTRWPAIRGSRSLHRVNARYRVMAPARLRALPLPRIHFGDAQDLSSLRTGFDLVISQMAIEHIADKARVLEESQRLLAPGGAFMHELAHLDVPGADLPRFAIANGSTRAHLERHGIALHASGSVVLAVYRDARPLRLGLVLDRARRARPWGVHSVYSVAGVQRSR